MRWPLRYQFLTPVASVVLAAVAAASALTAFLSAQRAKSELELHLRDVVRTLATTNFPLKEGVLKQTRGLSGAEFLVTDEQGTHLAASAPSLKPPSKKLPAHWPIGANKPMETPADGITLSQRLRIGERSFFYALTRLNRPGRPNPEYLHLFYPEERYQAAWRQAVIPPLTVGGAALLVMILLTAAIASRVTKPIRRLRSQVNRIAKGDFQPMSLPARDDELRDLTLAVNQMAEMLAKYEEGVRRGERLKSLNQLSAGVAHQLRNAVTGCRMALDLHQRELGRANEVLGDESLQVAIRQLALMEQHVRRFLTLGARPSASKKPVDLVQLTQEIIPLIQPMARHFGVRIDPSWENDDVLGDLMVLADEHAVSQLLVNLLMNAVEAVGAVNEQPRAPIRVTLARGDALARIIVADRGPGPAEDVRQHLFEPLVTNKPDGAGLGLAVAREVAQQHQGAITWKRENDWTLFTFEMPLANVEPTLAATACC